MIEASLKESLALPGPYAKELKEAMGYAVLSGGKRWRPLLLLSMYEMLSGIKKSKHLSLVLPAATALELIHNAALVHEDLPCVMNNKERRSNASVHQFYDNTIAILAGDALYTLAFEVAANTPDTHKGIQAIRILSTYAKSYGVVGGQAVEHLNKRKVMKLNTLRYIDMKKQCSLIQAASDIACIMAEVDENTRQVLNTYALNLGLAYQMTEDIAFDYNRGGEDLDFSDDYIPQSKSGYSGLMGFDKARKTVDKLIFDSEKLVKPFPRNEILIEFLQMIQERLP